MCRTPHGVRGLKLLCIRNTVKKRGGRTPHGVRGLKYLLRRQIIHADGRTPHGVRGLKSRFANRLCNR